MFIYFSHIFAKGWGERKPTPCNAVLKYRCGGERKRESDIIYRALDESSSSPTSSVRGPRQLLLFVCCSDLCGGGERLHFDACSAVSNPRIRWWALGALFIFCTHPVYRAFTLYAFSSRFVFLFAAGALFIFFFLFFFLAVRLEILLGCLLLSPLLLLLLRCGPYSFFFYQAIRLIRDQQLFFASLFFSFLSLSLSLLIESIVSSLRQLLFMRLIISILSFSWSFSFALALSLSFIFFIQI